MKTLNELLSEIEKRASEATEGPWKLVSEYPRKSGEVWYEIDKLRQDDSYIHGDDAEFIAHSRTDVPALLAVIRKLIEQRRQWCIIGSTSISNVVQATQSMDEELAQILAGEKV